jgi:HK97 family phage major capsid protein
MARINVLRQRKTDLVAEAEVLLEKQSGEEGLTEDEDSRYEEIVAEIETVQKQIAREEAHMETRRTMEAVVDVSTDTAEEAEDKLPAQVAREPEKFATFGDQLKAIAQAGMNNQVAADNRLIWGAALGANEAVPSEGGFLVQQDFNTSLLNLMHEMGSVVGRTRRVPISANSNGIRLPMVDESSRVDGSRWGGVQAYWANEADTVTASQPAFREMDLRLNKLFGLAYATDELLADSVALGSIMTQAFGEELTFKTEDAIVSGTGAGQPLGFLNSGAVIEVAAESGQVAATIVTANIINMFARLPRRSATNAVWLVNQDTWPQLWQLTLGSGTAVTLLYAPPGQGTSDQNAPFGTLLGRPVLPVEYAATLGTAGDIMLVDLSQYLMIDKGGVDSASSMHVRFINDEMTFRFIFRVDGQPAWNVPITPANGTATQSPFISLATRA